MLVMAMALLVFSCGKTKSSVATDENDSLGMIDSVASAQDEKESQPEEINVIPTEVLTLTPGKKNLQYEEESSGKAGTWTIEITNNGPVTVKGSDYNVTYVEIVEEWVGSDEDGGLDDKSYTRTVSGKDIAPNETVQIILKSSDGCQDLKSPKIVNISK